MKIAPLAILLGGFSICRCSSMGEHTLETGGTEVRFFSTPPRPRGPMDRIPLF